MAVKYLEYLKIIPGCKYEYDECFFDSIEEAIEFAKLVDDRLSMKCITIYNPNASNLRPDNYKSYKVRDVKDSFVDNATERRIYFSTFMDELYLEYYELRDERYKHSTINFLFDYAFMYDDSIPKFTLYKPNSHISTIVPFPFMLEEVSEWYGKNDDDYYKGDDIFKILVAYYANSFEEPDNRWYYIDLWFPWRTIPVSTIYELRDPSPERYFDAYNFDVDLSYYPYRIYKSKNKFIVAINSILYDLDGISRKYSRRIKYGYYTNKFIHKNINIKYFEHISIYDEAHYIYRDKFFKDIGKAIEYAAKDKDNNSAMKCIAVESHIIYSDPDFNWYCEVTNENLKSHYSKHSRRYIYFSNNMDEVYYEYYEFGPYTDKSTGETYNRRFIYDYRYMYSTDEIILDEKSKYRSSVYPNVLTNPKLNVIRGSAFNSDNHDTIIGYTFDDNVEEKSVFIPISLIEKIN